MKNILSILGAGFVLLTFMCFTSMPFQGTPWNVPADAKAMKNPVKSDAKSIAEGKNLYSLHCQSCHGKKGKGDGPKAATLETESGDFTVAAFKSETDGALFYKISHGRKDMPSFSKKISDASDIWSVINYVRTL